MIFWLNLFLCPQQNVCVKSYWKNEFLMRKMFNYLENIKFFTGKLFQIHEIAYFCLYEYRRIAVTFLKTVAFS